MALQCDSSVSHKLSINFDIIGELTSAEEAEEEEEDCGGSEVGGGREAKEKHMKFY